MKDATLRIPIVGLPCAAGDRIPVEKALRRVPGVIEAYVNPADESAYLTIDETHFQLPVAVETIESFGAAAALPERDEG